MPKEVLNIVDFSGGINKATDKRDLQPNEIVKSDGLISYRPGKLTLSGTFSTIDGLTANTGGFSANYVLEGIPNLYGIFPELSFRIFGKAKCTAVATEGTFTILPSNSFHSLDIGCKITVIKTLYTSTGARSTITPVGVDMYVTDIVNDTSFKATDASTFTVNDEFYYVINATYNSEDSLLSEPNTGYDQNRFFLKAADYGKFGFYSIGLDKYWYGRVEDTYTNVFGNDAWFFDTKYIWDFKQDSGGVATESSISNTKVWDAFYDDGVFRLLTEAPKAFRDGRCKRPVGLYAFDKNITRFDGDTNHRNIIHRGFYPLRSHCLSPEEYHRSTTYIDGENHHNYNGAGSITFHLTHDSLSDWDSLVPAPVGVGYANPNDFSALGETNIPHQLSVGIGSDNNATSGDWQFASGSEHYRLGLGVSFLYDDFENPQESNISPLITATNPSTNSVQMTSAENDKALALYVKLYIGDFSTLSEDQKALIEDNNNNHDSSHVHSVSEFRGSGMNNGYSNFGQWNPRIVGANIWLNFTQNGPIDDPLLLATLNFDFDSDTHGLSVSHDGVEADSNWTSTGSNDGTVHQQILKIPTVPVAPYSFKNGYKHNENIHAWYKTSAIVNRRLYAGNVSYYDKNVNQIEHNEAPEHFPDRILVSPPNKFDILPRSSFRDLIVHDSQDIVKLIGFNKLLLVFKHDDLFVIDCSGEVEILQSTHKGMGLISPTQVCVAPNAVYWMNEQGVYGMDLENPPANIIKTKLPTSEWSNNIYTLQSHIEYEPQDNLLMIFGRWKEFEGHNYFDKHLFVINIATSGLFYKSIPSITPFDTYSKGLLFNNKLYVASMFKGGEEQFVADKTQSFVYGGYALMVVQFTINNSSHPNTLGGTHDKYLFINKASGGWTRINADVHPLIEPPTAEANTELSADSLIQEWADKMNNNTSNSEYKHELVYVGDNQFFAIVKARNIGTAYNFSEVSVSGYSAFGNTAFAFSGTDGDDPDDLGDLTTLGQQLATGIQNGTNAVMPVYTIYTDRMNNSAPGVAYTINFTISAGDGSMIYTTSTYTTSTDPSQLYNAEASSAYTNDCDGSQNNRVLSTRLTRNIREFLMTNPSSTIGNLRQYFTFGAIISDVNADNGGVGDGGVTGLTGNGYFTMTAIDNSGTGLAVATNLDVTTSVDNGRGGSILKWESQTASKINFVHLETKDYDFGQPNVRKKVYKAYITYKASAKVKVYYQANQSGTWTAADVKNSTVDNTLPTSTEYTRGEISFGTGGNNIYSFALRFKGSDVVEVFDINDISFVFRPKRPK